jgi:aryl-alcohol dehydrogenase-like predicted oxidoreductase
MVFLPWAPMQDAGTDGPVADAAKRHGISERQVVLAWLLARSSQILPIPGTGSADHAEANIAAAAVELTPAEVAAISAAK